MPIPFLLLVLGTCELLLKRIIIHYKTAIIAHVMRSLNVLFFQRLFNTWPVIKQQ
jgi:hypothetical protein